MMLPLGPLAKLPGPIRVFVPIVSVGSLLGMAWFLGDTTALLIVLGGLVLVALLIVAYVLILKAIDKKKSDPFAAQLMENSSAAPDGLNDASRRARLDDLRKKFEEGVGTFKQHGKDMYSLPWYLLVGEPGSGKTEAIRRCNVGFPPGLQDQLQGVGGTINMNWWFTNQAVVLDTAGRLMFEEVEPGATSEWKDFLRLLRSARKNCPINGMLLLIPADSLVKDTAESLEKKGGKIAEQLDAIQRELGVRFPVFVIVSKCDLINGFREFFDDISDPQLQHQILGWSNPEELDDPFKTEQIDRYLAEVGDRLSKRRASLLLDPVNREDQNGRRVDEVDALFAFPDSFAALAPRLKRYLEMVFTPGEWSNRPLFLRGIYFTSSMREGSALDADLAEALGMSVESLPEGRVWEKDRAFFLRDLFLRKVFEEKGLVTHASNTRQLQSRRRMMILGSACGAVVLLLLLTWLGGQSFSKNVGGPRAFWEEVASEFGDASPGEMALVAPRFQGSTDYEYRGENELEVGRVESTLAGFGPATLERVQRPLRIPFIFRPVAAFSGDLDRARKEAFRGMLQTIALEPAITAAREKLLADDVPAGPERAAALAALLRLETLSRGATPRGDGPDPEELLPGLMPVVLTDPAQLEQYQREHAEDLADSVEWAFEDDWPAPGLVGPDNWRAASAGTDRFITAWVGDSRVSPKQARLIALRDSSEAFRDAELALLADLGLGRAYSIGEFESAVSLWAERLTAVRAARASLDEAVEALGDEIERPVRELVGEAVDETLGEASDAFESLLAQLPVSPDMSTEQGENDFEALDLPMRELVELAQRLESSWTTLQEQTNEGLGRTVTTLTELRDGYLAAPPASGGVRLYAARADLYERIDSTLRAEVTDSETLLAASEALAALRRELDDARASLSRVIAMIPETGPAAAVREPLSRSGGAAIDAADRKRKHDRFASVLDTLGSSSGSVADAVEDEAVDLDPIERPDVAMTSTDGGDFESRYLPEAATRLFEVWSNIDGILGRPASSGTPVVLDAETLERDYRRRRSAVEGYIDEYLEYWTATVREEASVEGYSDWEDFYGDLRRLRARDLAESLAEVAEASRIAAEAVLLLEGSRFAGDAQDLIERASAEGSRLDRRRAQQDWDDAFEEWVQLGDDSERAREALLDLRAADFERDFIPDYADEGDDSEVWFFGSLYRQGLRALVDSSQGGARRALNELRDLAVAFPLSSEGTGSLTLDEFQRAQDLVIELEPALRSIEREEAGRLIGEGAEIGFGELEDLMSSLRDEDLIRSNSERSWIAAIDGVLGWLDPARGGLTAELVILPYNEQPDPAAAGAYAFLEVRQGGRSLLGTRDSRNRFETDARIDIPSDAPVEFLFRRVQGGEATGTASLESPWGSIREVFGAEFPERVERVPGLEDVWKVPVEIADGAATRTYWIGLRFNRSIPERPSARGR
ncbi:MAG: type VI secretion protein IcmF/TssM N-terminal domain-containing protein [Planctomycetota bacterium]